MTSSIGTNLHAQFHFRQQQAFQRLLTPNTTGGDKTSTEGLSFGSSPRSFKSKAIRDEDRLDVNARDGFGRTVLHLASAAIDASSVEYVRLLLKHPAINVNLQDWESQWTALHRAMYAGNLGVVLLLLQHTNIDTALKDLEGYTALDLYNSTVEGTKPEHFLLPTTPAVSPIQTLPGAELFTWGVNRNASLGHGDTSDRSFPDQVPLPRPVISTVENLVEDRFSRAEVTQVKMGRLHTSVIVSVPLSDGPSGPNLSLCGFGSGGRLGVTQHTQYALRPLSWAAAPSSQSVPSRTSHQPKLKVISVALGQDHTLALTDNGEIYSWGLNRWSQLGYTIDDGSVAAQVFSLDNPSEFIPQSFTSSNSTISSNGEQIQLIPRRIYGTLKKEFILGVAASKGASACWVRESGGGGNVYTWGLNGGQLGYDRTTSGTGAQIQALPRKVTKINRPVVQIALGESAMACLISGPGSAGGGWKGDVFVFWGDQVGRVSFPIHTFPSPITPYRPPQALKSTRIVKIVCSDESPPPFSMNALSSSTSATSGSSSLSHKTASNLTAMLSTQSSSATAGQNHINFVCVSEGGEVFVFGVPGAPPVGVLGSSYGDPELDSRESGGSNMAIAKIVKPQRVWALRRGLVGAVRDAAIGIDGSLIVCTDSGHVYVRARSPASENAFGSFASFKSSGGAKSQRFSRVPYLQRVVGVCASSSGAFGALRVDAEVKPIAWPVAEGTSMEKKSGREVRKAVDAYKGWDLIHDMKCISPWTWRELLDSPLARERQEDTVAWNVNLASSQVPATISTAHGNQDKDAEEYDDDEGDFDIRKDINLMRELCALIDRRGKLGSEQWERGPLYGADMTVSVTNTKKDRTRASLSLASSSFSFPVHSVILGARSSVLSTALHSCSGSVLHCADDKQALTLSFISASATRQASRSIRFSGFHPLSILILMHYIYTDELLCIWDRRISSNPTSFASFSEMKVTPALGLQIKSELQSLARTLSLPQILKVSESVVKRPVPETLRGDLNAIWTLSNSRSSSAFLAPDVVLQLAEGQEVFCYSVILRARSAYFEDFLGDADWTMKRKGDEKMLKVDLRHLNPRIMAYVLDWLCCGKSEGLFGSLSAYICLLIPSDRLNCSSDFADSVDTVLEFLFEVIAAAVCFMVILWLSAPNLSMNSQNELLLFPLVLLTSQLVLKFLNIHNACYILTEAAHYHAFDLVSSVEGYISQNLETFLESHMLDTLNPSLIKHLSAFVRSQQERKSSVVRSHKLVTDAMSKWQEWLDSEDTPQLIMPSSRSLKRLRERKPSQAFSPPSPSHITSTSFGRQRVHTLTRSTPVRPSVSPILKPGGPTPDSDDIFGMDEMDIGPPLTDTVEHHSSNGNAWRVSSSIPRYAQSKFVFRWEELNAIFNSVDMRSVMAEAAQTKPAQLYTAPPVRTPPKDGASLHSISRAGSSQNKIFDVAPTPSPSTEPRASGTPWRTPTSAPKTFTPSDSFPSLGTTPLVLAPEEAPVPQDSLDARPQIRTSGSNPSLGPVFTPSRLPAAKSPLTTPRRISGAKSSQKAWVSAPVHEPLPPTFTSTTGTGISFIAIQQLQLEQGTSSSKDKRSLLEIQQEEEAKREEAEFLKWWEAEEERVRLETQQLERMQSRGVEMNQIQNQGTQQRKSRKGKGNSNTLARPRGGGNGDSAIAFGSSREQETTSSQRTSGPNSSPRRAPRSKKPMPSASTS
ncbi:hypothetical protein D9757_002585 [Collybiopsis confluens]|uniref:BTB domain-containing protein n=1 Tax=Collybiopsis confluens TaxID=2823264 RepID=A0A8H5MDN5_9AGAR|nr:hypothetical protein D9757_002585 [Collybiopsis confluens]